MCRDRATAYAEAAKQAAPQAVQVADVWHLWSNLAKAVEKTVAAHYGCLRSAHESATVANEPEPPPVPDGFLDVHGRPRRIVATIRERHRAVQELRATGRSLRGISRDLDLDYYSVRRYVCLLREGMVTTPPLPALPKPRRALRWILTRPERLRPDEAVGTKEIRAACPELDATVDHVRTFAGLMHEHHGEGLPAWIARVDQEALPHLGQFANGLLHDLDAVTTGLSSSWSSGEVEGQVTRVKLLKRAGYGRAELDLLRTRILLRT
ncbi:transposase [Streptomyces sp. NPDC127118]|uniref:transposase n=1 Tax=Streptomyces sp. NPDC127118 TaxID=3345369 RepID=UPI00362632CC